MWLGLAWGVLHAAGMGKKVKTILAGNDVTVYGKSVEDAKSEAEALVGTATDIRKAQNFLSHVTTSAIMALALTAYCLFSAAIFWYQIYAMFFHKHTAIAKGI